MTDDPEIPEDEDDEEGYEPQPAGLSDGDVFIFDRSEFEQDFDCYAAMCRDGNVWVLCKTTRKWVPVEGRGIEPAAKPPRNIRSVQ